jgi:phosphatidylglycerophosphate synthase
MKWLNISNSLSLLRIILVFPIVYLLGNEFNLIAFFVSLVAISTDYFDVILPENCIRKVNLGKY